MELEQSTEDMNGTNVVVADTQSQNTDQLLENLPGSARSRASDATWKSWTNSHPYNFTDVFWESEDHQRLKRELKYPQLAKGQKIIASLNAIFPNCQEVLDNFKVWVKWLKDDELENHDRFGLELWLSGICLAWMSYKGCAEPPSNGAGKREAVDFLIQLAFQNRHGSKQKFRKEAPLAVPPETVIADAVTTKDLPMNVAMLIEENLEPHLISWAGWTRPYLEKTPNVITFAFEAEVDDSKDVLRQLILDFYCAQLHLRAICLNDGPVFGAILNNDVVRIYVSYWNGDELVVDKVFNYYNLLGFHAFIRLYFALCCIASYQENWLDVECKRWDDERDSQLQKLVNSAGRPWRSNPSPGPNPGLSGTKRGFEDSGSQGRAKRAAAGSKAKANKDQAQLLEKTIENCMNSPDIIYAPTKVAMLAFDIVTRTKTSEEIHRNLGPKSWAEQTSEFIGEFEDPVP